MGLTQRKSRPLKRDDTRLRDDRLFLVACDDTYAPKQYFDFFNITRVHVHVIPTEDGTSAANHVLDRLLQFDFEEGDERWLLLDTDHCTEGAHLASFTAAIAKARQHAVKVALSKPSFELWLLLHHVDESVVVALPNASSTEGKLREVLGRYNKTSLESEHFEIASVATACVRAKRLDATVTGGDVPATNTTRVYMLWRAIVAKALQYQLPEELHALREDT